MFEPIANVLQLIVQPCYNLTGNWWIAILLFTLITKAILFPMSLWCQKNAIVMVQLMPDLNRLKVKYFGDKETIGEKQNALYKEKGYHPMLSLIPLAVQIIILFGLVDVIHSITDNGAPGTEFLGLVPWTDGGLSWIMPVLAGLSAVLMGFAQNRINPLQREQSRAEKNMTNGLSIGLSFVLGVFVAAGMAFYWICSNLSSILIQVLCNVCINPKKHIDYADLEASRAELAELEALGKENKKKPWQKDPLRKREKEDYKRFFNVVGKHIVFYSEGSGFYKYFEGAIEYLLMHSDATIHYVTNAPDDQIFRIAQERPRIRPYYIGQQKAITLLMKLDCDICVMSLEDLENYYLKRSYLRKDIEYVFAPHHMTSFTLVSAKGALDHYDTILCAGPHQASELRAMEEIYGTKEKRLVATGYPLLDKDIARYAEMCAGRDGDAAAAAGTGAAGGRPTVLIAPSWQEGNLFDTCVHPMIESLLGRGWRVVVRPHPEYKKRYRARWEALMARWAGVSTDELVFEADISSDRTIWTSDILITDWSSITCEFSFSTLKPCIFVDTPMKVTNPDWQEIPLVPTDISLRNQIGVSLAPEDAGQTAELVSQMLTNQEAWRGRIAEVRDGFIYNLGQGAEYAGEYLLTAILSKQEERKQAGSESSGAAGGSGGSSKKAKKAKKARKGAKDSKGSRTAAGAKAAAGARSGSAAQTAQAARAFGKLEASA